MSLIPIVLISRPSQAHQRIQTQPPGYPDRDLTGLLHHRRLRPPALLPATGHNFPFRTEKITEHKGRKTYLWKRATPWPDRRCRRPPVHDSPNDLDPLRLLQSSPRRIVLRDRNIYQQRNLILRISIRERLANVI